MFERTQKLECLGPPRILNPLIEKGMCKVCFETEVPHRQREANTISSWINKLGSWGPIPRHQRWCFALGCQWAEPGEWIHTRAMPRQLFSVIISCQPTGRPPTGWLWVGSHINRVTKADQCIPRLLPSWLHSWVLLIPVTTISVGGAVPLFHFTDACALAPVLSHKEVWALLWLFTFLLPTCCQGHPLLSPNRP